MALDFALHKLCIERVSVLVEQLPCPRLKALQKWQLLLSEYGEKMQVIARARKHISKRYCDRYHLHVSADVARSVLEICASVALPLVLNIKINQISWGCGCIINHCTMV